MNCCEEKQNELQGRSSQQKTVLWIVLIINTLMFVIEIAGGISSKSSSLLGDSLDMLGDAVIYGLSIYAIHKSSSINTKISLIKGYMMLGLGIWILLQTVYYFFYSDIPVAHTMGKIGTLALTANLICLFLLLSFREDNINMQSVWLCSRNDIVVNLGVLFAAFLVSLTQSRIPDLVVGSAVALIVIQSSFFVIRSSKITLDRSP